MNSGERSAIPIAPAIAVTVSTHGRLRDLSIGWVSETTCGAGVVPA